MLGTQLEHNNTYVRVAMPFLENLLHFQRFFLIYIGEISDSFRIILE
jgi:hypothetical protein